LSNLKPTLTKECRKSVHQPSKSPLLFFGKETSDKAMATLVLSYAAATVALLGLLVILPWWKLKRRTQDERRVRWPKPGKICR
jgi:hypothetical protein